MADKKSMHPDVPTLRLFLLGFLEAPEGDQVGDHLERCEACCRTALTVEDDHLVGLLRWREPDSPESSNGVGREESSSDPPDRIDPLPLGLEDLGAGHRASPS